MKTEGKLSSQAKKIIAVIIAILLVGLSYLFVFQKNLDATAESEAKIQKQESEYRRLQSLQRMCDDNEASAEKNAKTMNNYLKSFPSKLTQISVIYELYKLQRDTGLKITNITPGQNVSFFKTGEVTATEEAGDAATANVAEEGSIEDGTKEEINNQDNNAAKTEGSLSVNKIEGVVNTYTVGFTGTYDQMMAAFKWVKDHKQVLALGATSMSYDSTTGGLIGSLNINFYAMKGNGVSYVKPDLRDIEKGKGKGNVFGTIVNRASTEVEK